MTKCGDLSLRNYFNGKLQVDIFKQAIITYKKIQKSTIAFIDDLISLGVPDWRLDKFPTLYKQLISDSQYLTEHGLKIYQQDQLYKYIDKVTILC